MAKGGVNIVSFDGEYTYLPLSSAAYFSDSGLKGLDYHTVAIIGSQSTGKSTLLNLLFDTSFDVLDVSKGRTQTTKGINLSVSVKDKVIIVDIEGTDSQVRGEDGAAFEHMSALFALAVSDVLMVNMWTSEIGRYKAASVGLLKTIFEVNLKLFTEQGRKKILFLLRDFNASSNNLPALKKQIGTTMAEIWSAIVKPPSHTMLSVLDCFEFEFFTFAPRDFKLDEFKQDVSVLQNRFTLEGQSGYLFEDLRTDIPFDGLDTYYREIWTLIKSEKDLNIPSQKEMLANLRCNEIKQEVFQSFKESLRELRSKAGKVLISDLSSVSTAHMESALLVFDDKASSYHHEVYSQVRLELRAMEVAEVKDIFEAQIKLLKNDCIAKFRAEMTSRLEKGKPTVDLISKAEGVRDKAVGRFMEIVASSVLEDSGWDAEMALEELHDSLREWLRTEISKQRSLLEDVIKKTLSGDFTGKINKIIDSALDDSMWSSLYALQVSVFQPLEPYVLSVISGLGDSEEEQSAFTALLRSRCLEVIKSKVVKHNSNLVDSMTKRFNRWFLKDEQDVPRSWEKTNIEEVYKASRDNALQMLEVFRWFKLVPLGEEGFDGKD